MHLLFSKFTNGFGQHGKFVYLWMSQMIFTRHFSSSLMHNPLYALNWHISTDAEAPSDLTARLWLLVGKPFCAVLTVLPGTATSPKTATHLQIRQLLCITPLQSPSSNCACNLGDKCGWRFPQLRVGCKGKSSSWSCNSALPVLQKPN